jgi:hypothetical protein
MSTTNCGQLSENLYFKKMKMKIKKRKEAPVTVTVKSNSDVFMTIIVGNKQIGGGILEFEGDQEPFAKGRIKNENLGKGKTLFEKKLLVTTNVLDSNTAHNRIVITHILHYEDGTEIFSALIEDEVENHKDILSSAAIYNFKKSN